METNLYPPWIPLVYEKSDTGINGGRTQRDIPGVPTNRVDLVMLLVKPTESGHWDLVI